MKGVMLHALLAALGLAWAYRTWTQPVALEEKPSDAVTMLECKPEQLQTMELDLATHTVKLTPTREKDGVENWFVAQQKKKEEAPKPESADAGTPDKPAVKDSATLAKEAPNQQTKPFDPYTPVKFLGNKKLDDVLAGLLPLRAVRELGVITAEQEPEYGFDKVSTHLRITCGGQKTEYEIGGRTYGVGDFYTRDPKTKRVFLLPSKLVSMFQSAQFQLMQNDMHDYALADVDEAIITAEGKTRRLLQRDRAIKGRASWVDAAEPDRRNELFGNWFERVGRLRVRAYLEPKAEPGADLIVPHKPPVAVVTIENKLEGKPKGKLEIVRVDTDTSRFYYARSEATRGWVTLYDSIARPVEEDVAMVVGGESSADDATSAPAAP